MAGEPGDALRRFAESALIIYRAQVAWVGLHVFFAVRVVAPVFQLLLFTLLGRYAGGARALEFFLAGNAAVLAGFGGLAVASTLTQEGVQDTLPYLLAAPGGGLRRLAHRLPVPIVDGLFGAVFSLAVVALLFRVDLSRADLPALAASLLAGACSGSCLGFLIGLVALVRFDLYVVWNSIYAGLLVVTGASLPLAALPGWAGAISQVVPMTRSILAARAALGGGSLASVWSLLALELAVCVAYVALGWLLLGREETILRRRGRLGIV